MKTELRKYFVLTAFVLSIVCNVRAQSCQPINIIHSPLQQRLLQDFVRDCKEGHQFIEEIGIVALTTYQDLEGREVWSMYAMIDDRYQENPPKLYSKIGDIMVLVYQADSLGRTTSTPAKDKASLNKCLEKVLENRVYQRPLVRKRYIETPGPNGIIRKGLVTTLRADGNYWNNKTIIYNKDGTYKTIVGIVISDDIKE